MTKFCVDCKWMQPAEKCGHPNALKAVEEDVEYLVTGIYPAGDTFYCASMRGSTLATDCGVEAKLWEPKG